MNAINNRHLQPELWPREHGEYLYRFALSRVGSPEVAEDILSDTYLAAIRAKDRYEGRSSERTWLSSILKNKIVDHYRKKGRERSFTDLGYECDGDEERLMARDWKTGTLSQNWAASPDEAIQKDELWERLMESVDLLPRRVAEIFRLREIDDVPTEEICRDYGITPNNLGVIIHRARTTLRELLGNGGDQNFLPS